MKTYSIKLPLFLGLIVLSILSGCEGPPFGPPTFPEDHFLPAPPKVSAVVQREGIKLTWTFYDSISVIEFNVYRQDGAEELSNRIGKSKQRQFTDSVGLISDHAYVYSVAAVSTNGYEGRRSEGLYVTFVFDYPSADVVLAQPVQLDSARLSLSWTRNTEVNFASYRIFRSTSSPVDLTALPNVIINDALITTFVDRGLKAGTTYFYRVLVYNRAGLFAASNEVSGTAR